MNQAFVNHSVASAGGVILADTMEHVIAVKFHPYEEQTWAEYKVDENGKRFVNRNVLLSIKCVVNSWALLNGDFKAAINVFGQQNMGLESTEIPTY